MIKSAEQIKPKERLKTDFFSWNLYRWVKKYGIAQCHVYRDEDGLFFIGHVRELTGWFHGALVNGVLCAGTHGDLSRRRYAYPPAMTRSWTDVTDEFWNGYLERGACYLHDFNHKWVEDTLKTRFCSYCGKKENLVTKIIKKEVWQ